MRRQRYLIDDSDPYLSPGVGHTAGTYVVHTSVVTSRPVVDLFPYARMAASASPHMIAYRPFWLPLLHVGRLELSLALIATQRPNTLRLRGGCTLLPLVAAIGTCPMWRLPA